MWSDNSRPWSLGSRSRCYQWGSKWWGTIYVRFLNQVGYLPYLTIRTHLSPVSQQPTPQFKGAFEGQVLWRLKSERPMSELLAFLLTKISFSTGSKLEIGLPGTSRSGSAVTGSRIHTTFDAIRNRYGRFILTSIGSQENDAGLEGLIKLKESMVRGGALFALQHGGS